MLLCICALITFEIKKFCQMLSSSSSTLCDAIDRHHTLSSEWFTFIENGDELENINQASHLLAGYPKKPPTLGEALKSMGYKDPSGFAAEFAKKALDKLAQLNAPGLTIEDATAIFCYTYEMNESDKKKYGEKTESPYRVLNSSLSVDRRSTALKKTRGFLFLLLQALRKLPRHIPVSHTLYRGLRMHVQTVPDPEFPERKPYAAGNMKTW